jgi:hypothetical protein
VGEFFQVILQVKSICKVPAYVVEQNQSKACRLHAVRYLSHGDEAHELPAPMCVRVCICAYTFVLGLHACYVRVRLWTYTRRSPYCVQRPDLVVVV